VDGEDFVGTLTYSYLVEVIPIEMAHDIKSIGTKGQERLLGKHVIFFSFFNFYIFLQG
jgi:hypothetical protein